MQIKGLNMHSIASSLSLAIANYKPVPTIPSQEGPSHGRVSQVSKGSTERDPAEWGIPSVLNISSAHGNIFKSDSENSGEPVGPSGCTVQKMYWADGLYDVFFPPYDQSRANTIRYRKQVGVNIGTWFVLEAWMAPSMFSCAYGSKVSELDFHKGYGSSDKGISSAKSRLEKHWDQFIRKSDLEEMASLGINTVRLPIGYWTLGPKWVKDTPFAPYAKAYENSWKYVRRFIKWADELDIGVLVDVHGAYGSQNGQPISGDSEHGVQFYSKENRKRTREMLTWLTHELAGVNNVVGIQLLNEPQDNPKLWSWYGETMDAMRKASPHAKNLPLYYHDAFKSEKGAKFASKRKDFVVQDMHSYFVFTQKDRGTTAKQHTSQIKSSYEQSLNKMAKTARGNFIVGEWSCALNPQSLQSSSNKQKSTAEFCQAQVESYAKAASGFFFWTWKMEHCDSNSGWCFRSANKQKLVGRAYNAWGVEGNVTHVASKVAREVGSMSLPSKYSGGKLADPLMAVSCTGNSGAVENNGSAGANNAQVKEPGSGSLRQNQKYRMRNSDTASRTHTHSHTDTQDANSQHTSHHHHHQHHHHHHRGLAHEGYGGAAARAAAHVQHRRAAEASKIHMLGFTDGFVSGKSFAKLLTLSRIGFQEQYLADTLSHYHSNKLIAKGSHSEYSEQFKPGLKEIEKKIISSIKKSLEH